MAGTGIVIRFGKSLVLADEGDIVGNIDFGGAAVTEVIRHFREDRAKSVSRGGQLDVFSFRVTRQADSTAAAVQWLAERRRALRALNLETGLQVAVITNYGTPYKFVLENATVTPGPSTHTGSSTIETFTAQGALADKV